MEHEHAFRTVRRTKIGDRYQHVRRCPCGATMAEPVEGCTHQWRVTQQKATCHDETLRWKCALCDAALIETRELDYTSVDWRDNVAKPTDCADCQRLLTVYHAPGPPDTL